MALECMVGPIVGGISASELQDKDVLSNCYIHIQQLKDSFAYGDFVAEHKYLTTDLSRLTWIANYARKISEKKNTLILVGKIETGRRLLDLLDDGAENVVFVSGAMKLADRTRAYEKIKSRNGQIIIATYGVAAVGINLVRLHNVVLIEAGKSFVRVIQSIGRGLRRASDKDFVDIHDICSSAKFSKRHLTDRKRFYKEAGYDFKVIKVQWE
jgi:superfamily II DNA or RNA helicase